MERPITDKQKAEYLRIVENAAGRALECAGLDKDRLQRLIENDNSRITVRIMISIREILASYQSTEKEVQSNDGYPKGYKIKEIDEQVAILRRLFPDLRGATFDKSIISRPLPPDAEGLFAIPKWEKIGRTYSQSVKNILMRISHMCADQSGSCHCQGIQSVNDLDLNRLHQCKETEEMMRSLCEQQANRDILLVPAQFGMRYRGFAPSRVRAVFAENEFGLGSFAVGTMLLTHPERFEDFDDLWIDCVGDEYRDDKSALSRTPFFYREDKNMKLVSCFSDHSSTRCGSASAFLP